MALENSAQELPTDLICEKLLSEFARMGNQEQNRQHLVGYATKTSNNDLRFYGKRNLCGRNGDKTKFCR